MFLQTGQRQRSSLRVFEKPAAHDECPRIAALNQRMGHDPRFFGNIGNAIEINIVVDPHGVMFQRIVNLPLEPRIPLSMPCAERRRMGQNLRPGFFRHKHLNTHKIRRPANVPVSLNPLTNAHNSAPFDQSTIGVSGIRVKLRLGAAMLYRLRDIIATLTATTQALVLPMLRWKTSGIPPALAWAGAALVVMGSGLIFAG